MKYLIFIFLFSSVVEAAEIAIVVNPGNPIESMTLKQIKDIYLGRSRAFPNGEFAEPFDQASSLRADFYKRVVKRSIEHIDAYWARLIFSGRASPPEQLVDDKSVINAVNKNKNAIGYIDKKNVNGQVRLLLVIP